MQEKQPLVSVIIPTYNAEKFIAETMESVISQTYENWEMIVIDDCSTDSTCEIIEQYTDDERINLVRSEENFGGPARPRNVGLAKSKGEYVAFLDADDLWLPEKLQMQIAVLQNTNNDIVQAQVSTFGSIYYKKKYSKVTDFRKMLITSRVDILTSLTKKHPHIVFDEDKNLIGVEDYYYWLSLIHQGFKVEALPQVLAKYRITDTSLSHQNRLKFILRAYYARFKFMTSNYQDITHSTIFKILFRALYDFGVVFVQIITGKSFIFIEKIYYKLTLRR